MHAVAVPQIVSSRVSMMVAVPRSLRARATLDDISVIVPRCSARVGSVLGWRTWVVKRVGGSVRKVLERLDVAMLDQRSSNIAGLTSLS